MIPNSPARFNFALGENAVMIRDAAESFVFDLPGASGTQRVVMTMGKLGILDALEARTGKYLFSYDMGYQNLVKSIEPRPSGR